MGGGGGANECKGVVGEVKSHPRGAKVSQGRVNVPP